MNADADCARLVFPGLRVGKDSLSDARALVQAGVGGFCLYGGTTSQVARLTQALRQGSGKRLIFCADYEDGAGSQCPDAAPFISNMGIGAAASENLAFEKGRLIAQEARALGVDWVLAPVVDLALRPQNPIVNIRAFSSDPGTVARLARGYSRGLKSQGVMACLKHFPGHGDTEKDSHLELPVIRAGKSALWDRDLLPFRLLARNAQSVMLAHLEVPAFAKKNPRVSSLSPEIGSLLRRRLGFNGIIVTDALDMKAVSKRYGSAQAGLMALNAGADVLLVPEDPLALIAGLKAAAGKDASAAAAARQALKRLAAAARGLAAGRARPELSVIGCAEHQAAADAMARAAMTSVGFFRTSFRRVRYWEPSEPSPKRWAGLEFIRQLRALGAVVRLGERAQASETLIVGSFLSPRAYSGRIAHDSEEIRKISAAAKKSKEAFLVSFGSPFVFEQIALRGLCAFSKSGPSQRAAAQTLMGGFEARGVMPVNLKPLCYRYKR
ncbi:MAG: glycoside hydrolase family 3 N-terminal domain-containing protein [Elusimicrobiota bacterium]